MSGPKAHKCLTRSAVMVTVQLGKKTQEWREREKKIKHLWVDGMNQNKNIRTHSMSAKAVNTSAVLRQSYK